MSLHGLFQTLETDYSRLLQVRNAFVAASMVLWYDYALTFDREVRHYWLAKHWSWPRILFFTNRYFPLVLSTMNIAGSVSPTVSLPVSTFWIGYWTTIGATLQIFLIDLILCYRLYTLYGKNTKFLIGIIGLCLLTTGASEGVVGVVIKSGTGINEPIPGIHVCYASTPKHFLWAMWIPVLFFETIAFGLAAFKTYQHISEMKRSRAGSASSIGDIEMEDKSLGQRLVEFLFRDSLLYFACIFVLFLGNCLTFRFGATGIAQIFQGPTQSIMSILGSHMLFHTLEAVDDIFHPEKDMKSVELIKFAPALDLRGSRSPTSSGGTVYGGDVWDGLVRGDRVGGVEYGMDSRVGFRPPALGLPTAFSDESASIPCDQELGFIHGQNGSTPESDEKTWVNLRRFTTDTIQRSWRMEFKLDLKGPVP